MVAAVGSADGNGSADAIGSPAVIAASAADDATTASRRGSAAASGDRRTADGLPRPSTATGSRPPRTTSCAPTGLRPTGQLAGVVVTTKRLQALVADRAPRSQVLAAGRAAQRAHDRARRRRRRSYDGARRIMEPRLSLFEGIAAIRDYDAMLGRFDDLGDRIDSVVVAVD